MFETFVIFLYVVHVLKTQYVQKQAFQFPRVLSLSFSNQLIVKIDHLSPIVCTQIFKFTMTLKKINVILFIWSILYPQPLHLSSFYIKFSLLTSHILPYLILSKILCLGESNIYCGFIQSFTNCDPFSRHCSCTK